MHLTPNTPFYPTQVSSLFKGHKNNNPSAPQPITNPDLTEGSFLEGIAATYGLYEKEGPRRVITGLPGGKPIILRTDTAPATPPSVGSTIASASTSRTSSTTGSISSGTRPGSKTSVKRPYNAAVQRLLKKVERPI